MGGTIDTGIFKTGYGELIIGSFEDQLCLCDWRYRKMRTAIDQRIEAGLQATYKESESDIILETRRQLAAYFAGDLKIFDLPLLLVGSDFQKKIWKLLLEIPFGKTESYAGLSEKLGDVKAIRAVASANGANAISIIVPCHRVIGSDGSLCGYAGGLQSKRRLLKLENAFAQGELFPQD
jgi:methylated-DNA-[protein]-cysteine S-methyltransferase